MRRPLLFPISLVLLAACGRPAGTTSFVAGSPPATVMTVPPATSRVPPASTPESSPQPAPTTAPHGSGVEGSLVWNPPCRQSHPACEMPSRLLNGEVWAKQNGATVARTHTASYRFVLTLRPGTYVVNAKPDDPNYPTCSPLTVQVQPAKYTSISMECQSK